MRVQLPEYEKWHFEWPISSLIFRNSNDGSIPYRFYFHPSKFDFSSKNHCIKIKSKLIMKQALRGVNRAKQVIFHI